MNNWTIIKIVGKLATLFFGLVYGWSMITPLLSEANTMANVVGFMLIFVWIALIIILINIFFLKEKM